MKYILAILSAMSAFLGIATSAHAVAFYVDGCIAGNDQNDGLHIDRPLATIEAAIEKVQPGDHILIRGKHDANEIHDDFPGEYTMVSVTQLPSGNESLHVIIEGYQDEEIQINGTGQRDYAFKDEISGFSYLIIRGLDIRGYTKAAVLIGSATQSDLTYQENSVEDCTIRDNFGDGIQVIGNNNLHVLSNTIKTSEIIGNNGSGIFVDGYQIMTSVFDNELTSNAGSGMSLQGNNQQVIINGNDFDINGHWALSIDGDSDGMVPSAYAISHNTMVGNYSGAITILKTGAGEIASNYIGNSEGPGLKVMTFDAATDESLWIYNNVIVWQEEAGIYIDGGTGDMQVVHNTIYGNDQINNEFGQIYIAQLRQQLNLQNNIIVTASREQIPLVIEAHDYYPHEKRTITFNDIYANGGEYVALMGENYYDYSSFTEMIGDSNFSLRPKLLDPARNDFRIDLTSPCALSGTLLEHVQKDFSGVERGTPPSVGAYEPVEEEPVQSMNHGCGCHTSEAPYSLLCYGVLIFLLRKRIISSLLQ